MGFFPSETKIQTIFDASFLMLHFDVSFLKALIWKKKIVRYLAYSVTVASQSIRYENFVVCFFLAYVIDYVD